MTNPLPNLGPRNFCCCCIFHQVIIGAAPLPLNQEAIYWIPTLMFVRSPASVIVPKGTASNSSLLQGHLLVFDEFDLVLEHEDQILLSLYQPYQDGLPMFHHGHPCFALFICTYFRESFLVSCWVIFNWNLRRHPSNCRCITMWHVLMASNE